MNLFRGCGSNARDDILNKPFVLCWEVDAVEELGSVAGVQHNGLRPTKTGEAFADLVGEFERGDVFFVRT